MASTPLVPLPELVEGQRRRIKVTTKYQSVLTDATVTIIIKKPDGTTDTILSASLTHPSTGIYTYEYTFDQVGDYFIRAESADAVVDVAEGRVSVRASRVI